MATHSPFPAPLSPGQTEPADPARLPVEPEFGPMVPPAEPEEPGTQPPVL